MRLNPDMFEHVQKMVEGRKYVGDMYKHKGTGLKLFIARKPSLRSVFRKGRKSVSAALRDEVAEWSIEIDLYKKMMRLGAFLIGFHLIKGDELYMIKATDIQKKGAMKDYGSGKFLYYINFEHFWYIPTGKTLLK